jgi:Na+/melibiose symporter-like transporter
VNDPAGTNDETRPKQRYSWPWFLLAAVLLGIVLAIVWMSHEVERTRRNRDFTAPTQVK